MGFCFVLFKAVSGRPRFAASAFANFSFARRCWGVWAWIEEGELAGVPNGVRSKVEVVCATNHCELSSAVRWDLGDLYILCCSSTRRFKVLHQFECPSLNVDERIWRGILKYPNCDASEQASCPSGAMETRPFEGAVWPNKSMAENIRETSPVYQSALSARQLLVCRGQRRLSALIS